MFCVEYDVLAIYLQSYVFCLMFMHWEPIKIYYYATLCTTS